jgi:Acetyltransferases, including N-acetylases of ribosomal proteins
MLAKFPKLSTKRLILRSPNLSDVSNIIKHANNPKISDATATLPFPYHEKDAVFWIETSEKGFKNQDAYIFAIEYLQAKGVIGGIGLHINATHRQAELGYWLSEKYWNQGLMTEAIRCIINFGFEKLNLRKIHAVHFTKNPASGRIMIKNGMVKEGLRRDHILKNNDFRDIVEYGILNPNYTF